MGGEPYWYYVKYQADINAALQALRQQEFMAGRYAPVIMFLCDLFPLGPDAPAPGAQHETIDEAREETEEMGTRSILDLDHVSTDPEFCAVCPLPDDVLRRLYGTTQPTRALFDKTMDVFEGIDRGQGVYVVLYQDGKPHEICFAGYSFD